MGFAMIGLFLLHIAAVAKHQLLDRANILARMLPSADHRVGRDWSDPDGSRLDSAEESAEPRP